MDTEGQIRSQLKLMLTKYATAEISYEAVLPKTTRDICPKIPNISAGRGKDHDLILHKLST